MPSEAAMRAARAIREKGFFIDYIGRDAPDEWMVEIAEIIDREMNVDLGLAAPDNAAFLKSRQKP